MGPPQLIVRGACAEMRTSRVAALLGYLAVRGGRAVPRAEVAKALWAGRELSLAYQSLRQTLLYLRQALAEEADSVLVVTRHDLRLRPEAVETDLARFRALTARESKDDLVKAVDSYGGPFLSGIEDHWALAVRSELSLRLVKALLALAEEVRASDPAKALELVDRAIAEEPFHDGARAGRILALRAMGEETRALREFEEYEALLADEFGLRPAPVVEEALVHDAPRPKIAKAETADASEVYAAFRAAGQAEGALRLAIAMAPFWADTGRANQGIGELDRYREAGLAQTDVPTLASEVARTTAYLALCAGDTDRSMDEACVALSSAEDPLARALALCGIGSAHLRYGQMHEARIVAVQALRLARAFRLRNAQYEAWTLLSKAHTQDGALTRAAAAARRARACADPSSRAFAKAGIFLAAALIAPETRAESLQVLDEVLAVTANDRSVVGLGIRTMAARLIEETGDLQRAEQGYLQTLEERRTFDDPWGLAVSLTYLGDLRSAKGDHASAVSLHQEALAVRAVLQDRLGEATSLRGLGRAYVGLGDLESAMRAFREAARLYGESHALPGVASCLLPLAHLETEIGSLDLARRLAQRALRLLRTMSPAVRATIGPRSERLLPEAEALVASLGSDEGSSRPL
jgi:DNA-binding SARP family transcriptional activator